MINFIEDKSRGYGPRTFENARCADATLAFAMDFTTSGEQMTRIASEKYKKQYFQIPLKPIDGLKEHAEYISNVCKSLDIKTLNIAGNGMSRLGKYGITQDYVDAAVYTVLSEMVNVHGVNITSVRSGGQTGADEAGIKAAERLGIDSICLCPNGWRFRTETEDISDENLFKERFFKKN